MTKPISDYTVDELSKKIEAIKAERERTANALKRYEEELERKKQEASQRRLDISSLYEDWLKSLVDISKGEPIDIKVLLPLLKKGYVAYEKEYGWIWFKNKPFILKETEEDATWTNEGSYSIIGGFNIKPVENWKKSLMECGL